MATVEKNQIKIVKKLYFDEKLSAQNIADELGVHIDAVYYCMRKNNFPRRKKEESNLIRYEREQLSFNIKKTITSRDKMLKTIGTMLYWGEGSKADDMTVDFANSDKDMIILFLKFLREICGVDEKRLRVYPYFYANQDVNKNINFWSKLTRISIKQFTKPYIREDFDENKTHKMPHGLIHIRYSDKKLLSLIKNWINEYKNF